MMLKVAVLTTLVNGIAHGMTEAAGREGRQGEPGLCRGQGDLRRGARRQARRVHRGRHTGVNSRRTGGD